MRAPHPRLGDRKLELVEVPAAAAAGRRRGADRASRRSRSTISTSGAFAAWPSPSASCRWWSAPKPSGEIAAVGAGVTELQGRRPGRDVWRADLRHLQGLPRRPRQSLRERRRHHGLPRRRLRPRPGQPAGAAGHPGAGRASHARRRLRADRLLAPSSTCCSTTPSCSPARPSWCRPAAPASARSRSRWRRRSAAPSSPPSATTTRPRRPRRSAPITSSTTAPSASRRSRASSPTRRASTSCSSMSAAKASTARCWCSSAAAGSSPAARPPGPTVTINLMQLFQQQYKIFGSFGATMRNIRDSLAKMAGGMTPVIDTEVAARRVRARPRAAGKPPGVRQDRRQVLERRQTKLHGSRQTPACIAPAPRRRRGARLSSPCIKLRAIRLINPDTMSDFAGGLMRTARAAGCRSTASAAPISTAAFPEKSAAEIDDDPARRLGQSRPRRRRVRPSRPAVGLRSDASGASRAASTSAESDADRFMQLRDDGKPALIFAAHLANWEIAGGRARTAYGLDSAVLYRRAQHRRGRRRGASTCAQRSMGTLIADRPATRRSSSPTRCSAARMSACWSTSITCAASTVTFFGRRTTANPLLARLARQVDCPIHGARMVRLPGNRFRVELTEAIDAGARRRRQDRRRRHHAGDHQRGRGLGPRASRAMAVAAPPLAVRR